MQSAFDHQSRQRHARTSKVSYRSEQRLSLSQQPSRPSPGVAEGQPLGSHAQTPDGCVLQLMFVGVSHVPPMPGRGDKEG